MKKYLLLTILASFCYANQLAYTLIEEDIQTELKSGESFIGDYIPTLNASKIIKEVGDNEYAYTTKFNNKPIRIKSIVSGIKVDFAKKPYIQANGKNEFESIHLYMKNKDELLKLKKGDKIDLICKATNQNMLNPILKDCMQTKEYYTLLLNNVKARLDQKNTKVVYAVDYLNNSTQDLLKEFPNNFKTTESKKLLAEYLKISTNPANKTKLAAIEKRNLVENLDDLDFINYP